jgi:hypothetical protein
VTNKDNNPYNRTSEKRQRDVQANLTSRLKCVIDSPSHTPCRLVCAAVRHGPRASPKQRCTGLDSGEEASLCKTTALPGSERMAVSEGVNLDPRGPQGVRRASKSSAVPIIDDAK